GNSGLTNLDFTVALSIITSKDVTVSYQTADGSAIAGSDYVATSGTVTIPAGTASATISVSLIGDVLFEPSETFYVNLSNQVNAKISDAQGVGTIINDDAMPSVSINSPSVFERNSGSFAPFVVTLSAVNNSDTIVSYTVSDGTATIRDRDYAVTSQSVTIP